MEYIATEVGDFLLVRQFYPQLDNIDDYRKDPETGFLKKITEEE